MVLRKKRKPGGPPVIVNRTISRRSVVEWLGKGSVLALGAQLAAACSGMTSKGGDGGVDGGQEEPADSGAYNDCTGPEDFQFMPGSDEHEIFQNWGERTVDQQDLMNILSNWELTVDGMVETPITLKFGDILNLERRDQITDFHCVEGWSVLAVPWNGVHMSTLLEQASPTSQATHITLYSFDSVYSESLPLEVALEPRSLLAYGIDCNTLPLRSGFPLRMVVPRKWAYKSAKYINRIELTDAPHQGFWENHGYPYDADVPDERLREGFY